jgi:hypothetical protein
MSVLLWAAGQTWWMNLGYWPYGLPGRNETESWSGSNAPHLTDESPSDSRTTRLLAHGWTETLAFIDLERRGAQGHTVRRQIVHVDRTLWLVIDHTSGEAKRRAVTVWTTFHDVSISNGRVAGSYELGSESTDATLMAFLFGSPDTSTHVYRGSRAPFVGWHAIGETCTPASAVVVEQPANNSWAVAVWSLNGDRPGSWRIAAQPSMQAWEGPEKWTIVLPLESVSVEVARDGNEVVVRDHWGETRGCLSLTTPVRIDEETMAIQRAHERARAKYRQLGEAADYRLRTTHLPVVLRFLQDALFAVYRAVARPVSR